MAGNILYDLVDLGLLTQYVRAYDNEVLRNQFGLERYLPNQLINDLEYRVAKGGFTDVDTAEYRAFDTQPGMAARQGFSKIRGEIPSLARQIPLGEEHLLRLRSLAGAEDAPLVAQIYADVEHMVRAVQARVELARGQLLSTGKVTINENGVVVEADFGVPNDHIVTVQKGWSDPTATMLTDLLTWQQKYVDDNGGPAAEMLMSTKAFNYFLTNTEMKSMAAFGGTTPARLTTPVVLEILASYGLPVPVIYDTKVRIKGVQTRVIPEDKVIMLPPVGEPMGNTFYGVTAEAIKLVNKGLIVAQDAPGIVALVLENDNPVQTFTLATAIAMPVLPEARLLFVADIAP